MAWFDREFIAVPEDRKNQLVYKWPDLNIRRYTRAIVNADETALFVKSGRVVATMGPGRHRIDATELPVLGALVDGLTGGNFYRAELYFVSAREMTGIKFGGRLADISDPVSQQVLTLRVFGEFSISVRDPMELITSMVGTTDLASPAVVERWSADMLIKAMKVIVTQGISEGKWSVLGLMAALEQIEEAVVRQSNLALYEYGVRIPRIGNFDITLAPEDAERLKRLAKDTTYMRMAGGFQQYAAGELALGASQGFAHGGMGAETGFLGAALGINAIQQQPTMRQSDAVAPNSASAPLTNCARCRTPNPANARFCMGCGNPLQPVESRKCGVCGTQLAADTARFCGSCGTPVNTD